MALRVFRSSGFATNGQNPFKPRSSGFAIRLPGGVGYKPTNFTGDYKSPIPTIGIANPDEHRLQIPDSNIGIANPDEHITERARWHTPTLIAGSVANPMDYVY